mgnify:FL=1
MWMYKIFSPHSAEQTVVKEGKFEEIMRLISENYVDDVNIDSLSDEILPLLFEKLDPHSSYISAEDYKDLTDPIRGSFEGIGIQFNIQKDTIVVVQVIHGGPSEKIGLHAGDRIVTVNDSTIAGTGITNEKVIKLLKGPSGTKVSIGIKRIGTNELIPFEIVRGAIPIESVTSAYMLDDKTGFIAFDCFSQTTYNEFITAVKQFQAQGATNLIIDLRENGGGLLYTAIDLANEFLHKGDTIVFTKGRRGDTEYYRAEGNGMFQDMKLCVLINEYSASASEIFAGAMQDNGRGTIVGRRSFGKGVVNEDFLLQDSSTIRLSTKKFYTPSGRCIQKPYNGSLQDYDKELIDRFYRGELYDADSIMFPDSLKFTTRTGKIVYGGGGIMPDIFVPIDSIPYSEACKLITNSSTLYDFAFTYAEKNRNTLESMEFHTAFSYLKKQIHITDILQKQSQPRLTEKEIGIIEKIAQCYVIRDIFGDKAFYEIYNNDDSTILKALEALETNK